jgi:hypothetical protein
LWANVVTPKKTLNNSSYNLVYSKDVVMPISIKILVLQMLKDLEIIKYSKMEIKLAKLLILEEKGEKVFDAMISC